MSRRAWFYIWSVLILGALVGGFAFVGRSVDIEQWLTFAALTLFATLSQFLEAEAPGRQYYYPHMIFFFAGALLLDPFLFALLILIPHLIEWAKERLAGSAHLRAWYIQPFNISVHIIAGLTAYWLYGVLGSLSAPFHTPRSVIAVTVAALVYVTLNHIMVGLALVLARGISWRESGVLEFENLLTDFIMIYLGYIVAVLWRINPFLLIPALSPLVLMYRALMIPALKQQAQTDGKTGLLNAHHFAEVFAGELERTRRARRPLAVIMADLDLLRVINNTYGHLAGDAVLSGIGETIRKTIRGNDIAGRFGGEEFAIILPELEPAEAHALAERIRLAIEALRFDVATSPTPIRATMSLGVACFPADGDSTASLTQAADVAVYQAKLNGRNRVVMTADVPHSIKLEDPAQVDQVVTTFKAESASQTHPVNQAPQPAPTAVQTTPARQAVPPAIERPQPSHVTEHTPGRVWMLVSGVVAIAIGLTLLGFRAQVQLDLTALLLFAILAVSAELLQIDLYGTGTVSVSVGIAFAAALTTGLPGIAVVSAAIAVGAAVASSGRQQHPSWYKIAYNWGAHVLAGSVPALAIAILNIRLDMQNLAVLALPLAFAAVAYYAIDTALIAAAISLSTRAAFAGIWRQQFRWLAGHYLTLCMIGLFLAIAYTTLGWSSMLVFTLPIVMMRYAQQQYVARTEDSVHELKRLNHELASANHEVGDASRAIQQLNDELFLMLSKIIDARDPYVSGHAAKVADYATSIAAELGLPAERIAPIRQAALLHDIGKIGVSEHILHKPGKLTPEEYEQVKTHANLGAEFLETARGLRHLAPFVRHHHERWDGSGYPQGLAGEQTPLEARILAVCDAVEAMASDRPYQRAMSLEEIIVEVQRGRGTHFDPILADVFIRIAEREGAHLLVNSAEQVTQRQASAQYEHAQARQLLQFRNERV